MLYISWHISKNIAVASTKANNSKAIIRRINVQTIFAVTSYIDTEGHSSQLFDFNAELDRFINTRSEQSITGLTIEILGEVYAGQRIDAGGLSVIYFCRSG